MSEAIKTAAAHFSFTAAMSDVEIKCGSRGCDQAAVTLCDACLVPRCAGHLVYCYFQGCSVARCNGEDCALEFCTDCHTRGCATHINVCGGCGEFVCYRHAVWCEDCTLPMHAACLRDGRCPDCDARRDEFSEAEEASDEEVPEPDTQPE